MYIVSNIASVRLSALYIVLILLNLLVLDCDHDDLYARLLSSCSGLVEIKAHRVSDQTLYLLGLMAGSTLRVIDLKLVRARSESLELLFRCCPKLVSLSLSSEYIEATDALVRSLVNRCPLVETLSLSGWCGLSDKSLKAIRSLLHLRELRLAYDKKLTWSGVLKFVKNSPKLEVLHVRIFDGCADELLHCLRMYCPCFRSLACYGKAVTNDAVMALLQGCPLLEEVNIDLYSPNDQVLCAVAECPSMRLFSFGLPHLDLFTDIGLIALSRGCLGLTELHIHFNDHITDDAILSVARHCHKLVNFTVRYNNTVTSSSVCALINGNPGLTHMSLSSCGRIDGDQCLGALANRCPKLKSIFLLCSNRISNASFEHFVHSCQYLEKIRLYICDITDATIDMMARQCRRLKDVVLGLCPHVTEHSILSILTHSKCLNWMYVDSCNIVITNELRDRLDSLTLPGPSQRWLSVHINSQSWHIFPKNN